MQDHDFAVGSLLNIDLHPVGSRCERRLNGGDRVLGRVHRGTSVRRNLDLILHARLFQEEESEPNRSDQCHHRQRNDESAGETQGPHPSFCARSLLSLAESRRAPSHRLVEIDDQHRERRSRNEGRNEIDQAPCEEHESQGDDEERQGSC